MQTIKIPATQKSFYTPSQAEQNLNKINNVIKPKFGSIISNISRISNVPENLLYSFIFIESAGDPNAATKYATGLLQVSNAAASDAIVFEKSSGRLSKEEDTILKKYLGSRHSLLNNLKPNQKSIGSTFITTQDLLSPEFNVFCGALILGQLLDSYSEKGIPRLDKIVVIYNRGVYDKVSKKVSKMKGTTDDIIAAIPKGTGEYIQKLSGKNGLLDSLV